MKNYIKPTLILAGLTPSALSSTECTMPKQDLETLKLILGESLTNSTAFTTNDPCETPYDVGEYCKFTATEGGLGKILGS